MNPTGQVRRRMFARVKKKKKKSNLCPNAFKRKGKADLSNTGQISFVVSRSSFLVVPPHNSWGPSLPLPPPRYVTETCTSSLFQNQSASLLQFSSSFSKTYSQNHIQTSNEAHQNSER